MSTPLRMAMSRAVGWISDVKIPRILRGPIYRGYAALYRADLSEAQLPPSGYASLGAFFVRRLREGARPVEADPGRLPSPVDGVVSSLGPIEGDTALQAKGRTYSVRELLGGVGEDLDLDGGHQWTLYLSPRDYHRIHSPEAGRLTDVRPIPGARYSVNGRVLAKRQVLAINERTPVRIETEHGPLLLVMVGALNVGRIRVVGVVPEHSGPLPRPRPLERGEELGRFEMGSTVVLVAPPGGPRPLPGLEVGTKLRMGEPIGLYPSAR